MANKKLKTYLNASTTHKPGDKKGSFNCLKTGQAKTESFHLGNKNLTVPESKTFRPFHILCLGVVFKDFVFPVVLTYLAILNICSCLSDQEFTSSYSPPQ